MRALNNYIISTILSLTICPLLAKTAFAANSIQVFSNSLAATLTSSTTTNNTKKKNEKRIIVDRIVAIIENEIITQRDLDKKVQPFLAQLDDIKDPKKREERRQSLYKQVLDLEIGEKIVAKELATSREKLGVTDQDIDLAIEEVQRTNNLNKEQLQAALYGQGLTWSEYRKKLRDQIERARLIQFRVQGKVKIQDRDVKQRCEQRSQQSSGISQVCAAHILIAVPKNTSAQEIEKKRNLATRLRSELINGADFSAYALKYSDDKATPDGKLGCFAKGEMVKPFEEVAFALQKGQISKVVRTTFGFHIIKMLEHISASPAKCEDSDTLTKIRNELYQEEFERQMQIWVNELRKKSFVEERL
ncbi:MAG: peptidylprolyl isomerase [Deltaproteobacteria bacterium]|nr:peptidylprolyl isomerase [Deltaproteobacteria bacterium]